jgi:hypothetical protein
MSDPNGVLLQAFHAHILDLDQHLQALQDQAEAISQAGVTAVWLPTIAQLSGPQLSDLAAAPALEQQYRQTIATLRTQGMQIYTELSDESQQTRVDGFCLAIDLPSLQSQRLKQLSLQSVEQSSEQPSEHSSPTPFMMSECWSEQVENLHQYINSTAGQISLLDVPLHFNFHRASRSGGYYDMSKLLNNTLMQQQPALAVTFVENHRSQPLQPLLSPPESVVESWFKPLAYAIILLRREGYPCLFYPDYYGAHYRASGSDGQEHEIWLDSHRWLLDKFLYARQHYAYGKQMDYFDQNCVVGWTRWGNATHPKTMAVIMSDGWGGSKWMHLGRPDAAYHDVTEHIQGAVYTDANGWGEFFCRSGSVSVWLEE